MIFNDFEDINSYCTDKKISLKGCLRIIKLYKVTSVKLDNKIFIKVSDMDKALEKFFNDQIEKKRLKREKLNAFYNNYKMWKESQESLENLTQE